MNINLEILSSAYIYDEKQIENLHTKELVPKMITRRRLTRASKIVIDLAHGVEFNDGRIVYGSSFGELNATAHILNSIAQKEPISPTHFQNSVYNTAVSYLSMLKGNTNEIMTISNDDKTSLNVLQAGAIKALDGDILLLIVTETLNIDKIEEVNECIDFLECGVALKVRVTQEQETLDLNDLRTNLKLPDAIQHMMYIAQNMSSTTSNIVKIQL
ncbi:MAG: beta-ketoacyl synthase chain length factor [Campylobacterota bacterium]|nr:beta-ketoacyl synthase chain length factor [Campylobacterota bacterium]